MTETTDPTESSGAGPSVVLGRGLHHPEETTLGVTIAETVADVRGVDPLELPPIGSTIDVDALEGVLFEGSSYGRVIFDYAGYRIVAFGDGRIQIRDGEN